MFIDADLRAMIVARFELVGTEETPGVPDTPAGLAAGPLVRAARTGPAHLRPDEVLPGGIRRRAILDRLVVDAAEDHWQRMHAAALGFPPPDR